MSGNELAVDIDGDGTIESFPIAGVARRHSRPGRRVDARRRRATGARASRRFSVYDLKLAPEAASRASRVDDEGDGRRIDVLGVVDLDGDGRKELVLALRFPTVRTIVVYTATGSPERLELAGEATSFAH